MNGEAADPKNSFGIDLVLGCVAASGMVSMLDEGRDELAGLLFMYGEASLDTIAGSSADMVLGCVRGGISIGVVLGLQSRTISNGPDDGRREGRVGGAGRIATGGSSKV